MRFEILKVDHGFCAYAMGRDSGVLLFDCGHSTLYQPSTYLSCKGITSIRRFFVTNYDEDHISDLIAVQRKFDINVLTRNPSLTSRQIRSLKTPPISAAMKRLLKMIDSEFTGTVTNYSSLEPEGLRVNMFHNNYPMFKDTNNLSLLIFLSMGSLTFAICGDLEESGWYELLKNQEVKKFLRQVDVFIASHHGRENGYCQEVFNYCKPEVIVMSDGPVQYDTQLMASTYAKHASGINFRTPFGSEPRKVLTTRKDGNLYWIR